MKRTVRAPHIDGRIEWSHQIRWHTTLSYDNRWNVHEVQVIACYGQGDGTTYGHAYSKVGPFDDLDKVVRDLMVDAACACSEQLTLFDHPSA